MGYRIAAVMLAAVLLLCGCAPVPAPEEESGAGEPLTVYCFRAGKADAFLLMSEGGSVLIDTGESGFGGEILDCLERFGISSLDYLILTHFDRDHVGGAAKLLQKIPVRCVLQSNCPKDSSEYEKYCAALAEAALTPVTVRDTLCFSLGKVGYTVLPPARESYEKDASNNSSLMVEVRCGAQKLLFTGDAEKARLGEYLLSEPTACDFLKVPYHGHWQALLPALVETVTPRYAVITSSEEETEDDETTALLQQAGVQVFLTRVAPVIVRCDGTSMTVTYEKSL